MSNDKFTYDVFISYSSKDRPWVRTELLPRLEAAGLRACIDFRDFAPGAPTVDEIQRAVLTSRKTLLILTPNYLKSAWVEFESLMLQTLDVANRQRRLIPLRKAQCEIPLRISYLTYIDFAEADDLEFAWSRLLTALGAPAAAQSISPPAMSTPAAQETTAQAGATGSTGTSDVRDLRRRLIDKTSLSDLKDVCFAMRIDYDNYAGGKEDFIRDLLADLQKRGRIDEFKETLRAEKPWVLS